MQSPVLIMTPTCLWDGLGLGKGLRIVMTTRTFILGNDDASRIMFFFLLSWEALPKKEKNKKEV